MSPFIKKINLMFGLFLTVTSSYSYAELNAYACEENDYCCPCESVCGHGFIGAELLYWRPYQNGLDRCVPTDVSDTVLSDGRIISSFRGKGRDPQFDWNPGFRIGAGYELPCSNWDVGVLWTHYNSKAHRSFSSTNRLHWNIDLDVVDLLVAYQSDFSSCFSLRPYLGIKIARIDQKLRVGGRPSSTTFAAADQTLFGTDNKQNFTGVGPLFGLEVGQEVGCGFSVFLNGAVSWLYGNNNVRLINSIATDDVIDYSNIRNRNYSTLMAADASFGVRWQTCLCNKDVSFQLSYEHHRYFDYSRFGSCGDLGFDGLSLGIGVGY